MKHYLLLILIVVSHASIEQKKDRRAELNIKGGINEISISPDEKIWLVTSSGNKYYTNSIDSNWHNSSLQRSEDEIFNFLNNPDLNRVSFFNKNTAIISGYISAHQNNSEKNGYYLTKDAGKTWELRDFGGDSWIYTCYTDSFGNAWMGGLSKKLYVSKDFGRTWRSFKLPYKRSDRTYSIFMSSATSGVAGSDNNEIIATETNWKTVTHIKTPFDQKIIRSNNDQVYSDYRISKLIKWDNFLVVNQNGEIFYSDSKTIEWKSFPIALVDFEVDQQNNRLMAVTEDLKVVSFSKPDQFRFLSEKALSAAPIDIKLVNHSLYMICGRTEIYKVNDSTTKHVVPYTTDEKISAPYLSGKYSKLIWGFDGKHIYLAENDSLNWFREDLLNFNVVDFNLENDSIAILWDGVKNNYRYSLSDHIPKLFQPERPLEHFLTAPVKAINITAGSQGCFHSLVTEIHYQGENDAFLTSTKINTNDNQEIDTIHFKGTISSALLSRILGSINSEPSAMPLLKDFQITETDKKKYLDQFEKRTKDPSIYRQFGIYDSDKKFYLSVPKMLDTLSNSTVQAVLDHQENGYSTTRNWFHVILVNQNNDTLSFSQNNYVRSNAWQLPWKTQYMGINFNCYNLDFSRLIDASIPESFFDKDVFENSEFIMAIADYLKSKK